MGNWHSRGAGSAALGGCAWGASAGGVVSVFRELVLAELSFWRGDWALGFHSMGFGYFPDISSFPGILIS